jgi:hypothetical protein
MASVSYVKSAFILHANLTPAQHTPSMHKRHIILMSFEFVARKGSLRLSTV